MNKWQGTVDYGKHNGTYVSKEINLSVAIWVDMQVKSIFWNKFWWKSKKTGYHFHW